MSDFDRYSMFKANGKMQIVPFVEIRKKPSDREILYSKSRMRLDRVSYDNYEDPDFAWLIMQANPEYGSIENLIPDGVVLRVPFPLDETLSLYLDDITAYNELNKQ